jgi:hypothetical protein
LVEAASFDAMCAPCSATAAAWVVVVSVAFIVVPFWRRWAAHHMDHSGYREMQGEVGGF